MRGSLNCFTTFAEPSTLPSSMISNSQFVWVCCSTEVMHPARNFSVLYTGVIMETRFIFYNKYLSTIACEHLRILLCNNKYRNCLSLSSQKMVTSFRDPQIRIPVNGDLVTYDLPANA